MTDLEAVVFDVDGTLADTERHGHRVAFNRAFERLGLPYRWDEELYGELLAITGGERRIRHYLENHRGVRPEEAAGIARDAHAEKTRIFTQVVGEGGIPPRPGVCRLVDELLEAGIRVAVATTGSRDWVVVLLDRLLGSGRMRRIDPVITGDEAPLRKPDPQAYLLSLQALACEPGRAVAVEDSRNGVRAAKAAGMVCFVVPGDFSDPAELLEADLVTDAFENPGGAVGVLHNPHGVQVGPAVDARLLRSLVRAAAAGTG